MSYWIATGIAITKINFTIKAKWIEKVYWVILNISIKVYPARLPKRIRPQIPPRPWTIIPVVVVMEAGLFIKVLPGEPEVVLHRGIRVHRCLTERFIPGFPHHHIVLIHYENGSSKVIVEVVVYLRRGCCSNNCL